MVGVPTLILAIAGLIVVLRRRNKPALMLPISALTYYVAIVAPTSAHSRFLLGVVILMMPIAAYAAANAFETARRGLRFAGLALATLALLWQFALVVHLHSTLWNDSRRDMERWVRANVPPGSTIESSTQARYLPRLADRYRYSIVGNSFDAVSYRLIAGDLTLEQLEKRRPPYILVLADVGLSGDPGRVDEPELRRYYEALLDGRSGYTEVARFATPTSLPFRQLEVGTEPTTILLKRTEELTGSM
jgi:hypothetical protein